MLPFPAETAREGPEEVEVDALRFPFLAAPAAPPSEATGKGAGGGCLFFAFRPIVGMFFLFLEEGMRR